MEKYNFLNDYENKLINFENLGFLAFISFSLSLLIECLLLFGLKECSFKKFCMIYPIILLCVFTIIIYIYHRTVRGKDAKVTFKNFKDWYCLSPKRILVDESGFGFYFLEGNRERISPIENSEELKYRRHTHLELKTFIDFLKFTFFVEYQYKMLKYKKIKFQKEEEKVNSNNDLLRVLSILQKDAEVLINDSQKEISKEKEKIENYIK